MMKKLIILFVFNLTFLFAYSQNNDSLVLSQGDTTKSGYIIEIDTVEVTIKVTDVKSGKETLLTKQDKIKVIIAGGYTRLQGSWEIVDESTIRVDEVTVPISAIKKIKKIKMSKGGKAGLSVGIIIVGGVAIFVVILALIW